LLEAAIGERTQDITQQLGGSTSLNARPLALQAENKDKMGMYPLHWAAWHGSLDLAVMLVQRGGANPRKRDRVGMTAIHYAALMGYYKVVEWLLNQSPDLIEAIDKDSDTPLHCAAASGRVGVVQLLLDQHRIVDRNHGRSISGSDRMLTVFVNKTNKHGETPLHCAARGLSSTGTKFKIGLDPDRAAPPVSEEYERKVVELLLDSKANIEAIDNNEETPLHLAARWGRLTIAKTLLKWLPLPPDRPSEIWEKANVCAEDIHNDTPLHLAARWGHKEMVRVLYREKAPLEAPNKYGYTPCQVAEDHRQFHISDLLEKLILGSGEGLSDPCGSEESDSEESVIPGMRSAGTTANGAASFQNYSNGASSSGQDSVSDLTLGVHDESPVNVVPRTDPPPTELDEVPKTLIEPDVRRSLATPAVPRISHQDSGVGTDPSSRALAHSVASEEITPDDRSGSNSPEDPDWKWNNFPNAGSSVSGNRDSTIEPLCRSFTMPVDLEYSYNPHQEDEDTSLHRSCQLTRDRRRFSY